MPRFSGVVRAQDIGTAHGVSMRNEPTCRTAIDASPGFMPPHAARAGLGAIGFIAERNADPSCLCFVSDVLALPPVRPQADFLLTNCSQVFAIGDVAHIADHQRAEAAL